MNPVKNPIAHKLWQQYKSHKPIHTYAKGESILLLNEEPTHVHSIEEGIVRVYNITADGEERTVSFDVAGEVFPIGWVMGQIDHTEYFYQALTECKIRLLKRSDFLRYLRFHPRIAFMFYTNTARRYVSLQKRIYALEQSKASDKVLYILSYLTDKFGRKRGEVSSELQIPLTQQEIANFLGITRETTSTELKKLEKQKIIKYKHLTYSVNVAKLNERLEEL